MLRHKLVCPCRMLARFWAAALCHSPPAATPAGATPAGGPASESPACGSPPPTVAACGHPARLGTAARRTAGQRAPRCAPVSATPRASACRVAPAAARTLRNLNGSGNGRGGTRQSLPLVCLVLFAVNPGLATLDLSVIAPKVARRSGVAHNRSARARRRDEP